MQQDTSDALFVGIGTILGRGLSKSTYKLVFGAGAGYGSPLTSLGSDFHVYFVRGPLTARQLNLSPELAITDPGGLAASLVPKGESRSKRRITFVPHHTTAAAGDWEEVCANVGVHLIDPRWRVEKVLRDIADSDLVLAEAMHAAIIADSLRIPWIPIRCHAGVLPFKWMDWCSSLGLSYEPVSLPMSWRGRRGSLFAGMRRAAKSHLVARRLRRILGKCRPFLSSSEKQGIINGRLLDKLEVLRQDIQSGRIAEREESYLANQ
jgi:succinoglycan biosynthesis protein ExoV